MSPEKTIDSYPEIPNQPTYPKIEEKILQYWEEDQTFQASINAREGSKEIVFYDGPPFANGLPHYGHLLTGFVKDAMPRYFTMRGMKVERRFGWDCHGLPAETEAEKNLHVTGRNQINQLGVDVFNDYCRNSVMKYVNEWEHYVKRSGRWVDFQNDYKTMDMSFMESVIWAFAKLYREGLIYEDYRVLPYCWECETPLSNFETRQDDAYRERIDQAVTVTFDLSEESKALLGIDKEYKAKIAVWTTTPWTLPSNLALAIGKDITYFMIDNKSNTNTDSKEIIIIAEARYTHYSDELQNSDVIKTLKGEDLLGLTYSPIFNYFSDTPGAFVILDADFVSTEEGTGIVHLAPGFGEDDQKVCAQNNIQVICPVDSRGCFDERIDDLTGIQVFDANEKIINLLEKQHSLLKVEQYPHSYPHCWRTDTPLIYRAVSSFFVKVTDIRDKMVELNSNDIRFQPTHVGTGAFGNWLKGARDWSITRNRFWGSPIPVWKSDNPDYPRIDVYGSLDEIEADFGIRPIDLHRPHIDKLVRPNPDDPSGQSMMRRVEDVLDCWFDSGAMPFAQLHYPMENKEHFEENFPADFICEYIGQTRGWFYSLHVLSTALFSKPAFENCIAHGVVLGNDGRKLSKRLKNYPDPEAFFQEIGADAMRWYLLSSSVLRGQDVVMEKSHMSEPVKQILNPIYNAYYFLCLYGRSDKTVGQLRVDQTSIMDRYILAKTRILISRVTAALDEYDIPAALTPIANFLDALTNWYIRRSRERFWRPNQNGAQNGDLAVSHDKDGNHLLDTFDQDKQDAYDTLHSVLHIISKLAAPFLPFLSEFVYQGLTQERSVHLASWPSAELLPSDDNLVYTMDLVREICSQAHSLRKASGIRARLPLSSIIIFSQHNGDLAAYEQLIAEEINTKNVKFEHNPDPYINRELTIIPSVLGPRIGSRTQDIIRNAKSGNYSTDDSGNITVDGIALNSGEYKLSLKPIDEKTTRVLDDYNTTIVLDLSLTDELLSEGVTRDLIRHIQQARREAELLVSDRIELILLLQNDIFDQLCIRSKPDDDGKSVNYAFIDEIRNATLSTKIYVKLSDMGENEKYILRTTHESDEVYLNSSVQKPPASLDLTKWFHKEIILDGATCELWFNKFQ